MGSFPRGKLFGCESVPISTKASGHSECQPSSSVLELLRLKVAARRFDDMQREVEHILWDLLVFDLVEITWAFRASMNSAVVCPSFPPDF
jgi:hypothetical protein